MYIKKKICTFYNVRQRDFNLKLILFIRYILIIFSINFFLISHKNSFANINLHTTIFNKGKLFENSILSKIMYLKIWKFKNLKKRMFHCRQKYSDNENGLLAHCLKISKEHSNIFIIAKMKTKNFYHNRKSSFLLNYKMLSNKIFNNSAIHLKSVNFSEI